MSGLKQAVFLSQLPTDTSKYVPLEREDDYFKWPAPKPDHVLFVDGHTLANLLGDRRFQIAFEPATFMKNVRDGYLGMAHGSVLVTDAYAHIIDKRGLKGAFVVEVERNENPLHGDQP